ncbi:hypothetical protein ABKN59_003111 [Abortiporus biennis]
MVALVWTIRVGVISQFLVPCAAAWSIGNTAFDVFNLTSQAIRSTGYFRDLLDVPYVQYLFLSVGLVGLAA